MTHSNSSAGDGDFAITLGNTIGTNTVNLGNSTTAGNGTTTFDSTIVAGSGASNITVGAGAHSISVGVGTTAITVGGNSNNLITTAGGGGSITSNGNGNNVLDINSTAGSLNSYSINLLGTGSNTITHSNGSAGDDNFSIVLGNTTGTNTVNLGTGTAQQNGSTQFDSNITAGTGTNDITVGGGEHSITVGAGVATITVGGNAANLITVNGGGGTITSDGNGNNTVDINSASNATALYTVNLTGSGTNTVTHSNSSAGDGDFAITLGNTPTTNTVNLGSSTALQNGTTAFDSSITTGSGASSITVGAGEHAITVGVGVTSISIGGNSNNLITTAGGGGTITSDGNGNNVVDINSSSNSTATYNINLLGSGSNTVSHSNSSAGDDNYSISLGNTTGTNAVNLGNSTALLNGTTSFDTTITAGSGTSSITVGAGEHSIAVGLGATNITVGGNSNNLITTAGGGGTITSNGNGSNIVKINSTTGSTASYTISLSGTGTNTVTHSSSSAGDGDFAITLGNTTGSNTVNLGNSTATGNGTSTFDSTIIAGSGASNVTVGSGVHSISVGAGLTAIQTGTGNNTITTAGGGGQITTAQGNQAIVVNSVAASTNNYTITTSGTGNTTLTAGDDNYTIVAASGTNALTIGNGNSSIAATGAGLDTIVAGNGSMTITTGSANGDAITTGTGTVNLTLGSGTGDHITTAGGGGTLNEGNGNSDIISVGSGNYTILMGNGSGDHVTTTGTGNNTINIGTGGTSAAPDVVVTGTGNNALYVGVGTNTITGGSGSNTLYFYNSGSYNSITTTPLVVSFGSTGTSTATGTGVSDSFTGVSSIYGTNLGDTITLNTGTLTVHAGSGNDIITLGSGTDTVYAGNGNNVIAGTNISASATGDFLYGGTGNNSFTNPDAGTTYNGTNGAAIAALANNTAFTFSYTDATSPFASATGIPASVVQSHSGTTETISLVVGTQLNTVNYTGAVSATYTINLYSGQGIGGAAQSSTYATYATNYSTINEVIGSNSNTSFVPSLANTVLIGGTGNNTFYDGYVSGSSGPTYTSASETVLLVEDGAAASGNSGYFYAGPAAEIFVLANATGNSTINYQASPGGVVINLSSTAQTFSNTLLTTPVTIAAYSGGNMGADGTNSANSWANGDYYVPVSGTNISQGGAIYIDGSQSYGNLVYGGTEFVYYYGINTANLTATYGDYFYGGTGGSFYYMAAGNHVAVAAAGGGTNYLYTNFTSTSASAGVSVILDSALDSGNQHTVDLAFAPASASYKASYGGTAYSEFAYGYGNTTTPTGNAYGVTYLSGYENVLGTSGAGTYDYFVGDNNGNQVNLQGGTNTIILGSGINIIDAQNGTNLITSSGNQVSVGTNTLSFQTVDNSYSGILAQWNSGHNVAVDVFLNYSATSTPNTFFTSAVSDQATIEGGGYSPVQQVYSVNGYCTVQAGIITTINGSDYASGTLDTNPSSTVAAPSTANSTFSYDNVYSGAAIIRGHEGNNIFLDNVPVGHGESIYMGSASNLVYVTPSEIANLSVYSATPTNTTSVDILRVEGWGAAVTSGDAFNVNGADPFNGTLSLVNATVAAGGAVNYGFNILDVRSGTDAVNSTADTVTFASTANTVHPTFNLGATDILYITGASTTAPTANQTLSLKLDSGDIFTPTGTASSTVAGSTTTYRNASSAVIAVDTHNAANYYSDVYAFTAISGHSITLNVHYGAG